MTFQEYTELGGQYDETTFNKFNYRAEKKLEYWTNGKSKDETEDIKRALVIIIDSLNDMQGEKVTSFSNDGVSVSLEDKNELQELYNTIVEILPYYIISVVM